VDVRIGALRETGHGNRIQLIRRWSPFDVDRALEPMLLDRDAGKASPAAATAAIAAGWSAGCPSYQ
jgi:hypothetical protein